MMFVALCYISLNMMKVSLYMYMNKNEELTTEQFLE